MARVSDFKFLNAYSGISVEKPDFSAVLNTHILPSPIREKMLVHNDDKGSTDHSERLMLLRKGHLLGS